MCLSSFWAHQQTFASSSAECWRQIEGVKEEGWSWMKEREGGEPGLLQQIAPSLPPHDRRSQKDAGAHTYTHLQPCIHADCVKRALHILGRQLRNVSVSIPAQFIGLKVWCFLERAVPEAPTDTAGSPAPSHLGWLPLLFQLFPMLWADTLPPSPPVGG